MSSLHNWQQQFMRALTGDVGSSSEISSFDLHALDPDGERLAIHRNNWHTNLCQALRLSYPVVERLVGREFFDYCGVNFIEGWPSHSANLDDYGREFPVFLSSFPPASTLPYLGDVAALEAAIEAISAAEDVRMQLRVDSQFPILSIWQSNQPGAEDVCIDLDAGSDRLLVRREQSEVVIEKLHES